MVAHGHQGNQPDSESHTMVLDTYDRDNDLLIFKNTYDDESSGQTKKFTIQRTDSNAPEELFFVHIEIRETDNLPLQHQRKADKKAEEKDKEVFFGYIFE